MDLATLEQTGFQLVTGFVSPGALAGLLDELDSTGRAGFRNLLTDDGLAKRVALEMSKKELVRSALPGEPFPVRALFFDKTPQTNWNVSWHQDLSIAVAERREVPGFTGWALKEGVWHVQPPAKILERMITVRLHLDDCGPEHGPLRVIPGSHREGRLDREAIARWRATVPAEEIICRAGDALAMRPLLLHASSKATRPLHRRVLHVEYAADGLPGGLKWHQKNCSIGSSRLQ